MTKVQILLDIAMCLLWITTYTLVLIGSIRYQYPLISPITQAIIAPLEFSVLFLFIKIGAFRVDYASIAYLYWSIIEISIMLLMIKNGWVKKKYQIQYVICVCVITAIMIYWVTVKENMFFFTYLNTFSGIVIWLLYVIANKDFPMKPITLAIFIIKFIADIFALGAYFGVGNWAAQVMCVLLPVIDLFFVIIYIMRKIHNIA